MASYGLLAKVIHQIQVLVLIHHQNPALICVFFGRAEAKHKALYLQVNGIHKLIRIILVYGKVHVFTLVLLAVEGGNLESFILLEKWVHLVVTDLPILQVDIKHHR